ncbi:MAG: VWA domain-containing protein [Candidatus Acidiferrum sp.]
MRHPPVSGIVCCLASTLAVSSLYSQSPASVSAQVAPTIKVETRVVLVDVVVTNDKGEAVPGLGKSDFQIADEGAPQVISSFEEHKGVQPIQIKLPPMPSNVFTNFPTTASGDSVNVLLLDLLNTQPGDQVFARDQVIKYLSTVPPGTRLAIFTLGTELRMVRGFTTDFSGLSAALDDKKLGVNPQVSSALPTQSQQESENRIVRQMRHSDAAPIAIQSVEEFQADEAAGRSVSRIELTLEAFQDLARYLSGIPARKNLIWFSDNFPLSFLPDSRVHAPKYQQRVQQASDMLTSAQVAIYPVSALGVIGDPTFDASKLSGTRRDMEAMLGSNQIAMENIAKDTGGRAFYNVNALDDAVKNAVTNGSHYYTLAYSPADAKFDGKYHRIGVTLSSGSYTLSYRRGYYADKPRPDVNYAEQQDDPLMPLIGLGMPNFDQILYKVRVSPKNPQPSPKAPRAGSNTDLKPPFTRYEAEFAVSLPDIAMNTTPDGVRHGFIEVMLIAFDQDGKILNILKKKGKLAMDPQVYASTKMVGLQIREEIDVPPGDVYLRAGIFDLNSGSCGTVGIPLGTIGSSQTANK